MGLDVKLDIEFDEIDLKDPIQKSLKQITAKVQRKARKNAPIKKGTLRRSIQTDLSKAKFGVGRVYTDLVYARKREYVNFKNPHRKFYMHRAAIDTGPEIEKIFLKNLKDV